MSSTDLKEQGLLENLSRGLLTYTIRGKPTAHRLGSELCVGQFRCHFGNPLSQARRTRRPRAQTREQRGPVLCQNELLVSPQQNSSEKLLIPL